jgi:hypothetical protein
MGKYPRFSEQINQIIDEIWKTSLPAIHSDTNNVIYHVDHIDDTDTIISVNVLASSYKEYIATNNPRFVALFGNSYAVDPLSVGAVIQTLDSKIVLGKKRRLQAWEKQKEPISIIAGYVQQEVSLNELIDPIVSLYAELFEEGTIKRDEIVDCRFLGLVGKSYLSFEVKLNVDSKDLLNRAPLDPEFSSLIFLDIDKDVINQFFSSNEAEIMPKCLAALNYFVDLHFNQNGK